MLELPEAKCMSLQLKNALQGCTITDVIINTSPHKFVWFHENSADYPKRLIGQSITNVTAHAGQVEMQLGKMRLVLSDGVNIRLYQATDEIPEKHQLRLDFDGGKTLIFSVQMYGGIMAFEEGENQNPYYLAAKSKPSPLTDAFDFSYFKSILDQETKNPSLKELLATEQRIPGLGNGSLQDILYLSNLHPKRKLNSLADDEVERLYQQLKGTLTKMAEAGGRNTEKDLYGNNCGYMTLLSKLTQGKPCTRCGDIIRKENYLGGSIYYCPTCQKL